MQLTKIYYGAKGKMMNMLGKLNNAVHSITPHLSEATNGLINKVGIASVATGGTNAIVTTAIETQSETWLTVSNTVAVVSIIGSIMFIIKLAADVYYSRRRDAREYLARMDKREQDARKDQREQEIHDKLMSNDTPEA